MTKKTKKSSRKVMQNRLRSYPQSFTKHVKNLNNHYLRGQKGFEPTTGPLWT